MPVQYKVLVSILALVMAVVVFYFDTRAGAGASRWVALGLGPVMVIAIWLFPETKAKDIRREVARRR